LPVVPRGSRQQIVGASLIKSPLWSSIQVFHLTQNMRLDRSPESDVFAQWLLQVGSGHGLGPEKAVQLPANMRLQQNSLDGMIQAIYPGIKDGNKPDQYFLERALLTCKNDMVQDINDHVLKMFPGRESVAHSADKVADLDEQQYPVEFLNSLSVAGLPLAHLTLKPGCPLMLLRNLDPINGLCNGTRLILLDFRPRVLQCRILTAGKHAGKVVFIPRIALTPSEEELPIRLSRRQFPVRVAFAMTINKSQGQSVKNVGLDLRIPVFSHGQLYVALSRCTSGDRIKVLFPPDSQGTQTSNIVYPEVLQNLINPW
jgi:hypothetical protein